VRHIARSLVFGWVCCKSGAERESVSSRCGLGAPYEIMFTSAVVMLMFCEAPPPIVALGARA